MLPQNPRGFYVHSNVLHLHIIRTYSHSFRYKTTHAFANGGECWNAIIRLFQIQPKSVKWVICSLHSLAIAVPQKLLRVPCRAHDILAPCTLYGITTIKSEHADCCRLFLRDAFTTWLRQSEKSVMLRIYFREIIKIPQLDCDTMQILGSVTIHFFGTFRNVWNVRTWCKDM